MCIKKLFIAQVSLLLSLFFCIPVDSPRQPRLEAPQLSFGSMTAMADPTEGLTESVHLVWTITADRSEVGSFTLLRRFTTDSLFNVFTGSRLIPADTTDFYDDLHGYTFPDHGADSIFYRLLAIDTLGRFSDTSEICTVAIAPQPELTGYDPQSGCLEWESWIRGGILSWCKVRNESGTLEWTGERQEEFPHTDEPGRFSACFPDSLRPPPCGKWYVALFVRAAEMNSLYTGSIDVP